MVKPFKITLRRPIGKIDPIEELWTGESIASIAWGYMSLATQTALEKKRFVPFADTGIVGWQKYDRDPKNLYEYCQVEVYESDLDGEVDDEEEDEDDD